MNQTTILTPRLELRLQTPAEALAWVDSLPPGVRAEVSPVWVERVKAATPGDAWALGFVVVERPTGATVGGCAFKGPPDAGGAVEVAYGIDADHQRKGYATEAVGGLVAFAFGRGVPVVRAHTKEDNVASARVLEKCGFGYVGLVNDPEDGEVGRWERACEAGGTPQ